MPAAVRVKICGITGAGQARDAALQGASYIGLVFFAPSPRHLSLTAAERILAALPPGVASVALTVDADDRLLDQLTDRLRLDFLQLHGRESPRRAHEIRTRYGLPVIKALPVGSVADLEQIDRYGGAADQLLVDARAPETARRPGGNGLAFDWRLLAGRRWPLPWMLAGGLSPENVAEALAVTGALQVDVSSGVETAPGVKDAGLIAQFIAAARRA